MVGRDAIRDPGDTDLTFGTYKPLAQGRLGDEKRPGDLAGRETSEGAQR